MGLGGFTVQSLPLHGQIVLVAQAAQFASVAPLDPRSKVLKHLTMLALVVGAATVVDIVVAGIVSDIVEETCIVDEAPSVVLATPAQSHA